MTDPLAISAGLLAFAYGWGLNDLRESKVRKYYGSRGEGNSMFRSDDGGVHIRNLVLITFAGHGVVLSVSCLIAYALGYFDKAPLMIGMYLAGAGLVHLIRGRTNMTKDRKARIKQISYRNALKRYIDTPQAFLVPAYKTDKNGKIYVPMVAWIRASSLENLRIALTEWAAIPDDEKVRIWHDLKYHPED